MKSLKAPMIIGIIFTLIFSTCKQDTKINVVTTSSQNIEYFIPTHDKKSNLYIKEIGQGEPILVVHGGFGNDHTNVLKIANGLENQYRFIFYDQRGSSLSYCEQEAISVDNHLKDIETISNSLKLDRFTLVTHSAGTILGYLYLEKSPEKLKNLILLGAMVPKNGNEKFFTEFEKSQWDIAKQQRDTFHIRSAINDELEKEGLINNSKDPYERQKRNLIKFYAAQNIFDVKKWKDLNLPHWNRIAAQAASSSFDWIYDFSDILGSSKIPITVINGEYDLVVGAIGSPTWRNIVENDAQNIKFKIIEKAGHLAWVDEPETFKQLFSSALNK